MTLAFAGGLLRGLALAPHRYLDETNTAAAPTERTTVLWVTDEPPDRNGGGGNIRQANLLDSLAERFSITVLVVGRLDDAATRARVAGVIEVRTPAPRPQSGRAVRRLRDLRHAIARQPSGVVDAARTRRLVRPVLDRLADDFDVVVVHHLHLAPLLPRQRHAAWLLHLFDVASERARQEIAAAPGRRQRWLLRREVHQAARCEDAALAGYDRVIVVSDGDAAQLGRRAATAPTAADRIAVIPNGVDTSARTPAPLPAVPRVLFPGTLSYRPNVLGLVWFCDEVLPRVRRSVSDVQLAIVGRAPVAEVRALSDQTGVELHADVPSMTTWFDWARVVVVPLHIGTGTRLKALEAMAAARPVVGTATGLEGLGIEDGVHARIVDRPDAMADAIVTLLRDDDHATGIATAGRSLVQARFAWSAIAARMGYVFDEVVQARNG